VRIANLAGVPLEGYRVQRVLAFEVGAEDPFPLAPDAAAWDPFATSDEDGVYPGRGLSMLLPAGSFALSFVVEGATTLPPVGVFDVRDLCEEPEVASVYERAAVIVGMLLPVALRERPVRVGVLGPPPSPSRRCSPSG